MHFRSVTFAAAVTVSLLSAMTPRQLRAQEPGADGWPDFALGVTGGTLGVGLEASFKLNSLMVLRFGGSGYSWTAQGNQSGIGYDWASDIRSVGVMADLHPFGNGFRLSAGARYLSLDMEGDAQFSSSYQIGGSTYSAADIGSVSARYSVEKIAPYLGIGFDAAHFGSGFSIGIDLGAIYLGDIDVNLRSERSVAGLSADLAAEADTLKNGAWYKRIYPVATMSLKYKF